MAKTLRPKVRQVKWTGSGSRWQLTGFKDERGRYLRLFFPSRDAAEAELVKRAGERRRFGDLAHGLTAEQRVDAAQALDLLAPFGRSLVDAAKHLKAYLERTARSATVRECFEQLLAAKKADGVSVRHLQDLRYRLGAFADHFDAEKIAAIETAQVDDYLRGLKVAPATRLGTRRVVHGLFSFAQSRGYCAENPVAKTAKPKVVASTPGILTPEQLGAILAEIDLAAVPALAVAAFAGLRRAEIDRLDWSEIDLAAGLIHVDAKKAKTGARRLVRITPNLHAWLAPHARKAGPVRCPRWETKLSDACLKAGVTEWPKNALRHSYASHHLAHFRDANALALELGHTGTALLFRHYRELVRPDAAAKYWSIMPKVDAALVPFPATASA